VNNRKEIAATVKTLPSEFGGTTAKDSKFGMASVYVEGKGVFNAYVGQTTAQYLTEGGSCLVMAEPGQKLWIGLAGANNFEDLF